MSSQSTSPAPSEASFSEDSRHDGSTDESVSPASGTTSVADLGKVSMAHRPTRNTADDLGELFAENVLAKTCRVAEDSLRRNAALERHLFHPNDKRSDMVGAPMRFPEYCPQDGDDAGIYVLREAEFWTCGFFPGTLYSLLERAIRYPQSLGLASEDGPSTEQIQSHLRSLCRAWSEPLHDMATRTDTHDIGFIVMPALRQDWELTSNPRSLASVVRAAHSLATRYVPAARAIRSWDALRKTDVEITGGADENLIVIIDSMCNLDLLFYAAAHAGEPRLADAATTHARTLLTTHLRPVESTDAKTADEEGYTGRLYSTWHVAVLHPRTGEVRRRLTAQGYADESTWARGQAWAVLGYAQTYMWTKDTVFLEAACGLAEYFLYRLRAAPACVDVDVDHLADAHETSPAPPPYPEKPGRRRIGRKVPLWDFDAPVQDDDNEAGPTRDSSAGVIAANGMLVLAQALAGAGRAALATHFRDAAVDIVRDTLDLALARETIRFRRGGGGVETEDDVMDAGRFDALLKYGTANNNAGARKRYANHGLVYGDYYLVEFGNRLLRMGLV